MISNTFKEHLAFLPYITIGQNRKLFYWHQTKTGGFDGHESRTDILKTTFNANFQLSKCLKWVWNDIKITSVNNQFNITSVLLLRLVSGYISQNKINSDCPKQ